MRAMRTSDFDYQLPDELIARYPTRKRDASRLLIVDRTKREFRDERFPAIVDQMSTGDVLVLNKTKVIPARLHGNRIPSGGKVEIFLLSPDPGSSSRWHALVAPAKKLKVSERVAFQGSRMSALIVESLPEGERIVEFDLEGEALVAEIDRIGETPLPPYMARSAEASDRERYQTVYAEVPGAVAAPTAGLHFTEELFESIRSKGVEIVHVVLHTGIGTFRPVEVEDVADHRMHSEYYEVPQVTAGVINKAKQLGKKIFAVGTTTVRTLESVADEEGQVQSKSGETEIFIYPPYKFNIPDALITNFHMPRSTLLMMISAFADKDLIMRAYQHAIDQRYRFFSYGDAMLIL